MSNSSADDFWAWCSPPPIIHSLEVTASSMNQESLIQLIHEDLGPQHNPLRPNSSKHIYVMCRRRRPSLSNCRFLAKYGTACRHISSIASPVSASRLQRGEHAIVTPRLHQVAPLSWEQGSYVYPRQLGCKDPRKARKYVVSQRSPSDWRCRRGPSSGLRLRCRDARQGCNRHSDDRITRTLD